MIRTFPGRSTSAGAFTKTFIFDNFGKPILSVKTEVSKTGNHWEDTYDIPEDGVFIVLTRDVSNTGKDNSFFEIVPENGTISNEQKKLLKNLKEGRELWA